jgi:hypothetical protein
VAERPTVLLIDEGELALIRGMLDDLGVQYTWLRKSRISGPIPQPQCLLVTTATFAMELRLRRERSVEEGATWLALASPGSRTQRGVLRQAGFDLLVPFNVHPAALLLLLRRAVFDGADTQRGLRVAVGQPITISSRLRHHKAILVDLSASGCRLLADRCLMPDSRIGLRIPAPDGQTLVLKGRVVRAGPGLREGGAAHQHAIGVRFEPYGIAQRERLKAVLRERLSGPAELSDPTGVRIAAPLARPAPAPATPSASAPVAVPGAAAAARELGSAPLRVAFQREVTLISGARTRALLGRDLSESGMRVEPCPGLTDGQRVQLALHGDQREEPFLIAARVQRDEGRRGLVLRFENTDARTAERLRRLLRGLPEIQRFEEDTPTYPAVLAQLLSTRRRRGDKR